MRKACIFIRIVQILSVLLTIPSCCRSEVPGRVNVEVPPVKVVNCCHAIIFLYGRAFVPAADMTSRYRRMKKEIDRKFIRDLRRSEYIKEYYKEKYKKDIGSRGSAACFPEE